jgi:hypothetical protein
MPIMNNVSTAPHSSATGRVRPVTFAMEHWRGLFFIASLATAVTVMVVRSGSLNGLGGTPANPLPPDLARQVPADYANSDLLCVGTIDHVQYVSSYTGRAVSPDIAGGKWEASIVPSKVWRPSPRSVVDPDSRVVVYSLGEPEIKDRGRRVLVYADVSPSDNKLWGHLAAPR